MRNARERGFDVLLADPPWKFRDRMPGPKRGAAKHYAVMPVSPIAAFPLPPMRADAMLLLWRVAAQPREWMAVCEAWGFEPKAEIVWVKTKTPPPADPFSLLMSECNLAFGQGWYTRAAHEVCVIATRGRFKVGSRSERSVFFAPRGIHSAKPQAFYDLAERLTPGMRRAELFARIVRPGWTGWGDQLPGRPAHP